MILNGVETTKDTFDLAAATTAVRPDFVMGNLHGDETVSL